MNFDQKVLERNLNDETFWTNYEESLTEEDKVFFAEFNCLYSHSEYDEPLIIYVCDVEFIESFDVKIVEELFELAREISYHPFAIEKYSNEKFGTNKHTKLPKQNGYHFFIKETDLS